MNECLPTQRPTAKVLHEPVSTISLLLIIFTANIHPLEAIISIRIAKNGDAIMPSNRRNVVADIIGPNNRHQWHKLDIWNVYVTKKAAV